jgi:predicted DNA-binding antitoxin AbrB/MazE fold protein
MGLEIDATYQNGVLKPDQQLPLANGQRVKLTVQTLGSAVQRLYGIIPWGNDADELDRFLNDPEEGRLPRGHQ